MWWSGLCPPKQYGRLTRQTINDPTSDNLTSDVINTAKGTFLSLEMEFNNISRGDMA